MIVDELGPFDVVLDVGGNVGLLAERFRGLWPAASITSFEPLEPLARSNEQRARGRWWVERCALSSRAGAATMRVCTNQHEASSLEPMGPVRQEVFGLRDELELVDVQLRTLDEFLPLVERGGRALLKVDVEGHELEVLRGGQRLLELVDVAIVEVNQCEVFAGNPPPDVIDAELRSHGLYFAGVAGVQLAPDGAQVVQFDGVWVR